MNEDNSKYTQLDLGDGVYETKVTRKFTARKRYEAPDPNKIEAFIPGTVRTIFVGEGQSVRAGEQILILEAMKMKNVIRASKDCRIKRIYAKTDTMVPKGTLLIETE